MKFHPRHVAAALAGTALLAAGALSGCTPDVQSAPAQGAQAPQEAMPALRDAGDGIAALTQRVNWVRLDIAPEVQGF